MAERYDQARLMALQTFELLNVDGANYIAILDRAIELTRGIASLSTEEVARLRHSSPPKP